MVVGGGRRDGRSSREWHIAIVSNGCTLAPSNDAHMLYNFSQDVTRLLCVRVQVAAVSNTPLVSQAVSSPMVARSLLADPDERGALLALPYSRSPKTKSPTGEGTAERCW